MQIPQKQSQEASEPLDDLIDEPLGDDLVAPVLQPSAKLKQKLERNCQYAKEQQDKEIPKGFALAQIEKKTQTA